MSDESLLSSIERVVKASVKAQTATVMIELLALRTSLASQGEDLARLEDKHAAMAEQLTEILAQNAHRADLKILSAMEEAEEAEAEPRKKPAPKRKPNQIAINAINRSTLSRHDPG